MDLAKFATILLRGEIPLVRLDLFDDKFEGTTPRNYLRDLEKYFLECDAKPPVTPIQAKQLAFGQYSSVKNLRKFIHVSSWRLDRHESDALWRLYCGPGGGVAVALSYDAFRNQFEDRVTRPTVHVGLVSYEDFTTQGIPKDPILSLHAATRKRLQFKYEQEVRIVRSDPPNVGFGDDKITGPPVVYRPWDLESIEKVVVSPYAPDWYMGTVRGLIERLRPELSAKVTPSEMGEGPY